MSSPLEPIDKNLYDALDQLRAIIEAVPDIARLRTSHAELIAAAKAAVDFYVDVRPEYTPRVISKLQAAIAKAEGHTP